MRHSQFQEIFQSLVEFETLREHLSLQLQQIQCEHEALLEELGKHSHDGIREPESDENGASGACKELPSGTCEEICKETPCKQTSCKQTPRGASRSRSTGASLFQCEQELPQPKQDLSHPSFSVTFECDVEEQRSSLSRDWTVDTEEHIPALLEERIWLTWREDGAVHTSSHNPSVKRTETSQNQSIPRAGDELREGGCTHFIVRRPSSRIRVLWDVLSILVLGYDVLMLPLQPFNLPETSFTRWMNLMSIMFWSLDIYFAFTTGFHDVGVLEMRLGRIARRYMTSWFLFDIPILSLDYFLLLAKRDGPLDFVLFVRLGKGIRILRILRMFRLFRLLKAANIFGEWVDMISSEAMLTTFGILKLMLGITVVNHFLACGWYAVGIQPLGTDVNTWVKKLEAVKDSEESFAWMYTSSFHWSITQFTPASMEIVPCNAIERCYALCVILFALVAFSSFVSSITSSMTYLRSINMENSRQQGLIRQYIVQNRLSLELGHRIQVFLRQNRCSIVAKRVREEDIALFNRLPERLLIELHGQVFVPVIEVHPFFNLFYLLDEAGLLNVCHFAMSEQHVSCDKALFSSGEQCTNMFFVRSGQFCYNHSLDTIPSTELKSGDYIGEMGLWIQWEHQGRLVATIDSDVVGLDSQLFRRVARRATSYSACKKYAMEYARCLSDIVPSDIHHVSDKRAQEAFGQQVGGAPRRTSISTTSHFARFLGRKAISSTSLVSGFSAKSFSSIQSHSSSDLSSSSRERAE